MFGSAGFESETDFRVDQFRLVGTPECLRNAPTLHEFESSELGLGFRCGCDEFSHWFSSGNLFYAAVANRSRGTTLEIRALVSVFIADPISAGRLILGEILEPQLAPWRPGTRPLQPVVYFSSIICRQREWLPLLYAGLLQDLQFFKRSRAAAFQRGLTIACTQAGQHHLARQGFVPLLGGRYLDRYNFMSITPGSAKSPFWRGLFSSPADPGACRSPAESKAQPARALFNPAGTRTLPYARHLYPHSCPS